MSITDESKHTVATAKSFNREAELMVAEIRMEHAKFASLRAWQCRAIWRHRGY